MVFVPEKELGRLRVIHGRNNGCRLLVDKCVLGCVGDGQQVAIHNIGTGILHGLEIGIFLAGG